jgi:hypothetical protein
VSGCEQAPRYRVEHRSPDLATLIVGFADKLGHAEALCAVARSRFARERLAGEIAIIDRETDADVGRPPTVRRVLPG